MPLEPIKSSLAHGGTAMKITDIIAHPLSVALAQGRWTAHEFMDRAQMIL